MEKNNNNYNDDNLNSVNGYNPNYNPDNFNNNYTDNYPEDIYYSNQKEYYDVNSQYNPNDYNTNQDYYDEDYQNSSIDNNNYQHIPNYNKIYKSNNQNYNNAHYQQHNPNYSEFQVEREQERSKKNTGFIAVFSIIILILLSVGGYFGYTRFIKDDIIKVDLSQYEIDFSPYGVDGEGIAVANIRKIPDVKSNDNSVKEFLQDPAITYSKTRNLHNGDKVEIILSLSKTTAKTKKLELVGEFKRTFTVSGLNEQKISSSAVNDNKSSTSKANIFRENSSKNTKKLESYEVEQWVKAIYIKDNDINAVTSDFKVDIWLASDNLAYANIFKNGSIVGRYRVNGDGELEEQRSSSWNIVSRIYTELQ